ncbi:tetraacyldisaccharide 4'-kinase [Pleionea sediminis]|uniref:tetraacyldisaccharide 4'-kinase n=1 Tax=Pleionea sediminis TaxID=2569479 RepID=UPI00118544AD|nr:tetraacyldisaccharide 4'-kinase [Pleionea sediminis]
MSTNRIETLWYRRSLFRWILFPIHCLLYCLVFLRRFFFKVRLFRTQHFDVPVWVVGNITVGGTGKTPIITWLVESLKQRGLQPVVISRGYGGQSFKYPLKVTESTKAAECGDEPKMLFKRLDVPVVVDPLRTRAVESVLETMKPDVIISDDGLQHYQLERDLEICIVDGYRGWGNGLLMPMGPLREPISRGRLCDWRIINGGRPEIISELEQKWPSNGRFEVQPISLINLLTGDELPLKEGKSDLPFTDCEAVCGIGNPEKFKATLDQLSFQFHLHEFSDHHQFIVEDFADFNDKNIIMTEKDAVKCREFAQSSWWYIKVGVKADARLESLLQKNIERLKNYND